MVNHCIIFTITLVIGICGLAASIFLYTLTGGDIPLDYGLVIDAGSTHTQLTLYKWHGEKQRDTGWVEQVDFCRIETPLSIEDPELAGSSLSPCLANVTMQLPTDKKPTTQIFLGATAGFRILNNTEPYLSEAILISIQCALKSSGLLYKKAEIIKGYEEGLFGWISTNFLTRALQTDDDSKTTLGALDLGGASTQIAFSLNDSLNYATQTVDNATITLKLYGRDHLVQSTSYLCYGVLEIHNRHLALLADSLKPNQTILDPCSATGFQFKISAEALFGQACTRNDKHDEYLFNNRHDKNKIFFTFNGTSNTSMCKETVEKLLDPAICQKNNFSNCFSPPTNVPTTKQFQAFSTFYYLTKFLNATSVSLNKYRQLKDVFCSKPWQEVQQVEEVDDSIVSIICFEAHYIDLMLTDKGYGFDNLTWSNLHFENKVNGSDAGWSMGYMINATNLISPEMATESDISLTVMIILIIISICVLIVSALFFRKYRIQRESDPSYLRV